MGDPADQVRAVSASGLRQRLAQALATVLVIGCAAYEIAAPGGVASLRVSPDTVHLDVGDSVAVRALALDATGALRVNEAVAWSSSASAIVTVDTLGMLRALAPGSAQVRGRVGTFEDSALVLVQDIPGSVTLVAGDGQSATVGSAVAVAPRVRVNGTAGGPLALAQVTFAVASGGGSLVGPAVVTTDAAGEASPGGWVLGTALGANTLTATVTGDGVTGNPVTFTATATAGAPSAARSGVTAAPDTIAASSGSEQSVITVTVRDALGNVVSGATVSLAASGAGTTITQPATPTDAQGRTTGLLSATAIGAKVITATVGGSVVVDSTATVVVTPGAAAAVTAVAGDGQSATVSTSVAVAPRVRVVDAFGTSVPGVSVTFAVTAGGGTVTPLTAVLTDASGDAAVTSWTLGALAGTHTLSATVAGAGITGNPVTFTATALAAAPSAANSGLTIAPATVVQSNGDRFTDVTVTVRAANGIPILGATVALAATGSGNIITQPVGTTDLQGVATGRVASTIAGAKVISALVNGSVTLDSTATLTVDPLPAESVTRLSTDGQTGTVNTAVASAPAVRVLGAGGLAVEGVSVTFAVTGGGGSITGPATVLTDVAGEARVAAWVLGPTAGANTLSATVAGTGITGNPVSFTATATAGVPSSALSGIAASPATIAASAGGTVSTITVRVRDANGNPVPNVSVALAATGAGNTVTQPAAVTDANGVATGTISSTVAAVKVVSATVDGSVVVDSTATVTVDPAAASQLVMITQPAGAVANTAFTTQPVVEVRDAFGNRVTSATTPVTVARATGEGTLDRPAGPLTIDAVAGRATFTDLRIRGPNVAGDTIGVGDHSLEFTAAGLTTATSSVFAVDPSFAYNVQFMVRLPFPLGCVGCHGAAFANYTSLVNAPGVFNCPTSTRVVPFDTANSLMYEVVRTTTPFCSVVMPSAANRWSTRLQNLLRDWILRGALNN